MQSHDPLCQMILCKARFCLVRYSSAKPSCLFTDTELQRLVHSCQILQSNLDWSLPRYFVAKPGYVLPDTDSLKPADTANTARDIFCIAGEHIGPTYTILCKIFQFVANHPLITKHSGGTTDYLCFTGLWSQELTNYTLLLFEFTRQKLLDCLGSTVT